jgi:hypothetical protein
MHLMHAGLCGVRRGTAFEIEVSLWDRRSDRAHDADEMVRSD